MAFIIRIVISNANVNKNPRFSDVRVSSSRLLAVYMCRPFDFQIRDVAPVF